MSKGGLFLTYAVILLTLVWAVWTNNYDKPGETRECVLQAYNQATASDFCIKYLGE